MLNKHAPIEKRFNRANQKNFIDKELDQAIMVRSKLCSKFLKLKTEENQLAYNRQRNYCVKLLRQNKKWYFENLNINSITNNKLFWKTVCLLFSKKHISKNSKILRLEKNEILTDDAKIAETFNSILKSVVNTLNIEKHESILRDTGMKLIQLKIAINTYRKHPSILRIKRLIKNPRQFYFRIIDEDLNVRETQNLNLKKSYPKR